MRLFAPDDLRPVHFMGVAGAGMSALALLARRRGVTVTGCDRDADAGGAASSADVRGVGGLVFAGHDPSHVEGARRTPSISTIENPKLELRNPKPIRMSQIRMTKTQIPWAAFNAGMNYSRPLRSFAF